jgi:hypothetical protein
MRTFIILLILAASVQAASAQTAEELLAPEKEKYPAEVWSKMVDKLQRHL